MPQQKVCEYCKAKFIGRANQSYCNNAHKVRAFRERESQDKEKMLYLKEPTYFLFRAYAFSYHERHSPDVCRELNLMYNIIQVCKELIGMEGMHEYQLLKERLKEESKQYVNIGQKIENKIHNGEYSQRFTQFMGANLLKLPKLYQYIARKQKQILGNAKKLVKSGEVEVKLDTKLLTKLQKLQESYRKLWLVYKNRNL